MSCYEWESGTIVIPSKEWAGFKKNLRKAFNDIQTEAFESAKRIYEALMAKAKGKRNIKRETWDKWWEELATRSSGFGSRFRSDIPHRTAIYDVLGMDNLTGFGGRDKTVTRPKRPMKKDFPLVNGKTTYFNVGHEASIHLSNDKQRSVTWDVPENNHAREHAREEALAGKFFALLNRITWTRGSGGKIIGNDEYTRDAGHEYEGGGGSYLVEEFGPKSRASTVRGSW
jgi:hypothetical protein